MRVLSAFVSETASADAPTRSVPFVLAVALPLVALSAVVAGFVLVALSLVGIASMPVGWGAGLCVGGWALAAVGRERAASSAPEAAAPAEA